MLDSGDEVLIPDLSFSTYTNAILACGGKPVYEPLSSKDVFYMKPYSVCARVAERTKVIILNSPSNANGGLIFPSIEKLCA
jgi:aspartate/methionine/tyrosine aminotransferase